MNYTLNIKTNNSEQFEAFLSFIKSFGLVDIVDIKKDDIESIDDPISDLESLIIPPKIKESSKKYFGIWENKDIKDIKQFREGLWQR